MPIDESFISGPGDNQPPPHRLGPRYDVNKGFAYEAGGGQSLYEPVNSVGPSGRFMPSMARTGPKKNRSRRNPSSLFSRGRLRGS
jgi:hypothetical protein